MTDQPDYTAARDAELRALFQSALGYPPIGTALLTSDWDDWVEFAKAVAAAEREACARECEQIADDAEDADDNERGRRDPSDPDTALYCAAVIRRRAVIDQ